MANLTLAIDNDTHASMKKHTDIRWSEFVRKAINQRIKELETIESSLQESVHTMLASQQVLAKDWDNEYDERWNNL